MTRIILAIISLGFTGFGIYLFGKGDMTNGFLSLIMGELVDRHLGNKAGRLQHVFKPEQKESEVEE